MYPMSKNYAKIILFFIFLNLHSIALIGVKKNIVGHVTYYLQQLEDNCDMMHTVIQGPPGVGKTMLGKILGKLYYGMGILKGTPTKKRRFSGSVKNDFTFKVVKRSDLIGKYLGHTAIKTQKVIDSCKGGVMFIDEAYSLGNKEGRDSFSKECIDTINQNLTENKANFLCIIAGYKESLDKCFFSYNEGLRRRFTFKYTIESYTPSELRKIFIGMVKKINWIAKDENIPLTFFEQHYDTFENLAGDMETLLFNCKIEHGKRVFCLPKQQKILSYEDIKNGFEVFTENRGSVNTKFEHWKSLYV